MNRLYVDHDSTWKAASAAARFQFAGEFYIGIPRFFLAGPKLVYRFILAGRKLDYSQWDANWIQPIIRDDATTFFVRSMIITRFVRQKFKILPTESESGTTINDTFFLVSHCSCSQSLFEGVLTPPFVGKCGWVSRHSQCWSSKCHGKSKRADSYYPSESFLHSGVQRSQQWEDLDGAVVPPA